MLPRLPTSSRKPGEPDGAATEATTSSQHLRVAKIDITVKWRNFDDQGYDNKWWRHEQYASAKICAGPHLSTFGPGHKVLLRRDIRRLLDILTRKHFERNTTRYILEGASYSWFVFWELGWHLFFAVKLCIFDIHCMVAKEDTCACAGL